MTHVPDGWRLAPHKITISMADAMFDAHRKSENIFTSAQDVWDEMLAAAPTPPASGEGDALRIEDIESTEDSRIVPRAYLEHILGVLEQMPAVRDDDDLALAIGQTRAHIEIPAAQSPSLAEEVGRLREALMAAKNDLYAVPKTDLSSNAQNVLAQINNALSTSPPPTQERPIVLGVDWAKEGSKTAWMCACGATGEGSFEHDCKLNTPAPALTQERDEAWEGLIEHLKWFIAHETDGYGSVSVALASRVASAREAIARAEARK